MGALLLKAHVKGYTKGDGTYVAPHETKAKKGAKQAALFGHKPSLFGDDPYEDEPRLKSKHPGAATHPQVNDKGEAVIVRSPNKPSPPESWTAPDGVATFVPDGDAPGVLNGIKLTSWENAPTSIEEWAAVPGQVDIEEPPMPEAKKLNGKPKEPAAGVVIEESDGRVWIVRPTNGFGGYRATFPKGRADDGLPLQAVAIKEAYEESGLQVEITGYLGDIVRTETVARYYRARRVGGTPAEMGWETQAVQLASKSALPHLLNAAVDHQIVEMLGKPAKMD